MEFYTFFFLLRSTKGRSDKTNTRKNESCFDPGLIIHTFKGIVFEAQTSFFEIPKQHQWNGNEEKFYMNGNGQRKKFSLLFEYLSKVIIKRIQILKVYRKMEMKGIKAIFSTYKHLEFRSRTDFGTEKLSSKCFLVHSANTSSMSLEQSSAQRIRVTEQNFRY